MTRAIIYARVSTKNDDWQAKLNGQIDVCTQYAANKNYVIVDAIQEIPGISGKEVDRPELNKILFRSDFDVLICRDLDRLSRDNYALGYFEHALKENSVTIEYVNQTFDDTPSGELHKDITSSFTKYERKMIAYRMRMGRYRAIKAGNVLLSIVPYGYDKAVIDGIKTLVVNKQEAEIIRRIFALCLHGQSTYQIADYLTSNNIPTRFNWHFTTVLHILKSRLVGQGEWSYTFKDTGETLTVKIPSIVDKQTFLKAQKQLEKNKTFSKCAKPERYLLSGLCKCSNCDYTMSATTKIRYKTLAKTGERKRYSYPFYRCVSSFKKRPDKSVDCSFSKSFSAKKIDNIVWQTVKDIMSDPDYLSERLLERLNNQDDSPELKRLSYLDDQITETQAKLGNCLDELLDTTGEHAKAYLRNRRDDLEAELNKLNDEKELLIDEINSTPLLSQKRIKSIVDLAIKMGDKLELITNSDTETAFEAKRHIIKMLDTKVYIGQLDNGYSLNVVCCVSENMFELDNSLSVLNKAVYPHIQEQQKIILEIGYILDTKLNVIAA